MGRVVETEVERIVPGGAGLAHAGGRTLFVGLAAPGDRVRARIERVAGKVAFASIVEVLEAGAGRVEPACPYFGEGRCGGCDFQQMGYEAQLAAKVGIVRDCLRRIAGVEPPAEMPIAPSPAAWGYRTRAEWRHDPGRRLGYLARDSHRVVDVAVCPIASPGLNAALGTLRERLDAGRLPGEVREFRAAAGDEAVGIAPPLDGEAPVEVVRTVAGERYRFDADTFFQPNGAMLEPLVAEALRFAPTVGAGAVGPAIDLYCGVGLFTLPLARRFAEVVGVEAHRAAAAYGARNLADAGLRNARVDAAAVEPWLARHAALAPVPFLLLDPPRTGAGPAAVAGILALRPERIAYVACDPATLGRDLRALVAGGYGVGRVALLDLFPQTHHVETVVHLERGG